MNYTRKCRLAETRVGKEIKISVALYEKKEGSEERRQTGSGLPLKLDETRSQQNSGPGPGKFSERPTVQGLAVGWEGT